jgi:[ribosomal protein S5]-alanine N-acetyltransferase
MSPSAEWINGNEDTMTPVTYETDRLVLKGLNKDAASMVLHFYEDNKSEFEPWEPKRSSNFYTLSYQKASLAAEQNQMTEGKLLRYWVFLKDHPEDIIGTVCFQNFLREPYQSCILGYKFSHFYWHQGYALESITKCIDNMFSEYFIHRIEAYIMPDNMPSRNLIEKLDFQLEGLIRSFARIDGHWTDHFLYSLINPLD